MCADAHRRRSALAVIPEVIPYCCVACSASVGYRVLRRVVCCLRQQIVFVGVGRPVRLPVV